MTKEKNISFDNKAGLHMEVKMPVSIIEKGIYNTPVFVENIHTSVKKVSPIQTSDSSNLSSTANQFKDFHVGITNSNISEENGSVQFQIDFNQKEFSSVTVDGSYSESEKKLEVDFKILFEKIFNKGDQKTSKTFQIELSIKSSKIEINSTSKKVLKENIHEFLSRVLNDLTRIINSSDKNVTGIVFNKEDLQELIGLGDKDIGKLLDEILMLVKTLSKMKKEKSPDAENVLFAPERQKEDVVENKNINSTSVEVSMKISEVTK